MLMDEEYNDIEKMYRVGRSHKEIIRLKRMLKRRECNKQYYQNNKDKFKHFKI
jgi:hypothetical protein